MNFIETLSTYRNAWNRGDAKGVVDFFSDQFQGSYAHTLTEVDTSTRESALEGWESAFSQFRDRPFQFVFEDLAITPLAENGMLVVGWVKLYFGERCVGNTCRMEVWREEENGWRLLRDHQEYNLPI